MYQHMGSTTTPNSQLGQQNNILFEGTLWNATRPGLGEYEGNYSAQLHSDDKVSAADRATINQLAKHAFD